MIRPEQLLVPVVVNSEFQLQCCCRFQHGVYDGDEFTRQFPILLQAGFPCL